MHIFFYITYFKIIILFWKVLVIIINKTKKDIEKKI